MSYRLLGPAFPFPELFRGQVLRVAGAASALRELLEDIPAAASPARRIRSLESEARAAFHRISRELALVGIRPQEGEDLRELSQTLDAVLRTLGTLAARVALPPALPAREAARLLASLLHDTAALLPDMLARLQRSEPLDEPWRDALRLREETGKALTVAAGELFEDADAPPLESMRWLQVFDRLEEASAGLERCAWILTGMELRRDR